MCTCIVAQAVEVDVQPVEVGTTPKVVGINPGHFVEGSNTRGWWEYSNSSGARLFAGPNSIERDDDIEGHGDGVVTLSDFESRKSALRADHTRSGEPSDEFINWSFFNAKFESDEIDGDPEHGNVISPKYFLNTLREMGQSESIIMQITAGLDRFIINDEDDWAGKWELWQHYYARAYYYSRYYDITRFSTYNEPNHSSKQVPIDKWLRRLKLVSDAVRCALEDVNEEFGKSLTPIIMGPENSGSATSSTGVLYGDAAAADRHVDYLGNEDPNYWLFQKYSFHHYNGEPDAYTDKLNRLQDRLRASIPEVDKFPLSINEVNAYNAKNFDAVEDTLDYPAQYSRLGGIFQRLLLHGVDEMYCFKFSDTRKETITNYGLHKNSLYYADSDVAPFNVGGANRGGEVARLFYKGFAPGRTLLQTTADAEGGDLHLLTSYDPVGDCYYVFSANYNIDGAVDREVRLDLSALNIPFGNQVVLEEVSSSSYGGAVMYMDMPADGIITRTQPAHSVWLFTVSAKLHDEEQVFAAVEDAQVRDGIHNDTNYGSAATLKVRNDWTTKDNRRAALIKFDLTGVDFASVDSAVLTLPAAAMSGNSPLQAYVYAIDDSSWSESFVTWNTAPNLSSPAAGDNIVNKFVDGIGYTADVMGQLVVESTTVSDKHINITDYVRNMSASQVSFLVVQDPRWNQTLPIGPAGDQQADGLVITSSEGGVGPQLTLRLESSDTATYAITYDGNGSTGGIAPSKQTKTYDVDLTVASNTGGLVKVGSLFNGWNTAADGSGIAFAEGATFSANAPTTLYAQWVLPPRHEVLINFQPIESETVPGYLVDAGDAYGDRGNDHRYGWNVDNFQTRDRGDLDDPLLDTLNHSEDRYNIYTWELDVPNGEYEVVLSCSDPRSTDMINDWVIEGQTVTDPDGFDPLDVYTVRLMVTDGRLSLSPAATADNAKISVLEVRSNPNVAPVAQIAASTTSGAAPLTVNFSSSGSSDSDGSIVYRNWDFGTGSRSTKTSPSHIFDTPGIYEVTLRVIDDDGAESFDSVSITVTGDPEPNVPPIAQLSASTTSGVAPLAVSFSSDGSIDSDGSIVSYAWDFGDGSSSDAAHPNYAFTTAGTYVVRLTVTDDDGARSSDSISISVTNSPPVAVASASITSSVELLPIDFSSDGSGDEDGIIVSYAWDFGDGTSSNEANPSHIYVLAGTYTVTLTVTDDQGVEASDSLSISVTEAPNEEVLINFQPVDSETVPGYLVDAGDVYGNRGNGRTYGWNVDVFETRDRGVLDDLLLDTLNHAQEKSTRYTWELELANGVYEVVLTCSDPSNSNMLHDWVIENKTVYDLDGLDSLDVFTVTVGVTDGRLTITPALTSDHAKISVIEVRSSGETPNRAPVAQIDSSTFGGVAPLPVNFSSANSSDPDGTIVAYDWDFGDGSSSSSANPSHTFDTVGTYTVTLTVTDDKGAQSSDSLDITVYDTPNTLPDAQLTASTTSGAAPLTVDFSSANSSDRDGTIVSYAWDFGDGNSSNSANPSHTFTAIGTYTVTLTVTDDDGGEDSNSLVITVIPDQGDDVFVNFQPAGSETVPGYLVDAGDAFADRGNGQSYGWNVDVFQTRDRGTLNDPLFDTLNHAQYRGVTYTWELAVANGDYEVTLICSDPRNANMLHDWVIENQTVTDPDGLDTLDEFTVTVSVSDGRLTITPAATAENAKISVVEVRSLGGGGGGNNAPNAQIAASTTSGQAPLDVVFSSAGSSDSDGSIVSYAWDFGTGSSSSKANPSHVFDTAGVYTVTLTVTDDDGAQGADSVTITVTDPPPPPGDAVLINFQPVDAEMVPNYLVDAGDAFGNRGNGQSYGWNADVFQTRDRGTLNDPLLDTLNHAQYKGSTYTWELAVANGDYEVTLICSDPRNANMLHDWVIESQTVYDLDGLDNLDEFTVTVSVTDGRLTLTPAGTAENAKISVVEVRPAGGGGGNNAPTARIDASTTSGAAPLIVDFSAVNSSDSDGSIVSYEWNFGTGSSSIKTSPSHTFDTAGTYTVTLTVTDDDGAQDIDSISITVTDPPQPPGGVIWAEDFEGLANGSRSDTGSTAWTTDASSVNGSAQFGVNSGAFHAGGTKGVGVWQSEAISIAGAGEVTVSLDIQSLGQMERRDYVALSYRLDGGSEIEFANYANDFNGGNPEHVSVNVGSGSALQIIIRSKTSALDEIHVWDNITVRSGN